MAAPIGLLPILRIGYPDFSQMYSDNTFAPLPGHSAWWGNPSSPSTCNMCGPATAADAAFWFSDLHGKYTRLAQVQQGGSWANATAGDIIEELAVDIGAYENWTPDGTAFPGTSAGPTGDLNYIKGQANFFAARSIPVRFTYINVKNETPASFYTFVVDALESGKAIEMSNVGHWFAIAGARTDLFDDNNNNSVFDTGDTWITDYNGNGQFDEYFYVDNPWPNHASQDWETFSATGADWLISGDSRPLDSVVFLTVPEPVTVALIGIGLVGLGIGRRKRAR